MVFELFLERVFFPILVDVPTFVARIVSFAGTVDLGVESFDLCEAVLEGKVVILGQIHDLERLDCVKGLVVAVAAEGNVDGGLVKLRVSELGCQPEGAFFF